VLHRRRRFAVGSMIVAIASAGAWFGVAASTGHGATSVAGAESPPAIALATVDAFGILQATEPGWQATRLELGTYELHFPTDVDLALRTWTAIAHVTSRPVGDGTWVVTFHAAPDERVDSAFTFLASPAG
jgi:hypothetical protein